jgi:hypothetical protein
MTQQELKRLFIAWKESKLKESRAAWRCYGSSVTEAEYNWEDRLAYISFVRGYELAMKEAGK